MSLSGPEITRLIPHAGSMCLIRKVEAWDEQRILCSSESHRDPAHPLRRSGRLSSVHAIEYAAQAMALHGALRDPRHWEGRMAYLVAVRDVVLAIPYLDDVVGSITISAALSLSDDAALVYGFELVASHREIAGGRLTVVRAIEKERS